MGPSALLLPGRQSDVPDTILDIESRGRFYGTVSPLVPQSLSPSSMNQVLWCLFVHRVVVGTESAVKCKPSVRLYTLYHGSSQENGDKPENLPARDVS